jgi:hypothetical protein
LKPHPSHEWNFQRTFRLGWLNQAGKGEKSPRIFVRNIAMAPKRTLTTSTALIVTLAMTASTVVSAAAAQDMSYGQGQPPQGQYPQAQYPQAQYPQAQYPQGQYPQDPNQPPPQGGYGQDQYGGAPPPPPPPPPGYDGTQPPPPPPGYDPRAYAADQARDAQLAAQAQAWSQANCVKAHGNAGEGAVLGGLFGAIIGSGLAGRGSHGTGALAGAAVGAAGGAVIASNVGSNETSPGCPPGYVLRDGAAPLYVAPAYAYAAPGWYNPWVFYGGAWVFRPYPYHAYYYHAYYRGGYRGYHR